MSGESGDSGERGHGPLRREIAENSSIKTTNDLRVPSRQG